MNKTDGNFCLMQSFPSVFYSLINPPRQIHIMLIAVSYTHLDVYKRQLAGSAVGILVVGQAEGQKAVPQISLEAVGGRQLHQLAGETVRELRLRLR